MIDRAGLDPDMARVLDVVAQINAPKYQDVGAEQARAQFDAVAALRTQRYGEEPVKSVEDRVIPDPGGDLPIRVYRPMTDAGGALTLRVRPPSSPPRATTSCATRARPTRRSCGKPANLERDPRVAVTVIDGDNPYRYVQVRGRAKLVDEGAKEHIDKLARKYTGADYKAHRPDRPRVIVRVETEAIDLHG